MLAYFVLDGLKPVGQGQISYGKTGHGYHSNGKILKPYKRELAKTAKVESDIVPLEGPVTVALRFEMPQPKKWVRDEPTVTPDVDHLIRAALDALTGVWYLDDKQVIRTVVDKAYAAPGSKGRTVGGLWDGRAVDLEAFDRLTHGA